MPAACVMRRTFNPKDLASLKIAGNGIVADRVALVKNEGDVRAIQLARKAASYSCRSPSSPAPVIRSATTSAAIAPDAIAMFTPCLRMKSTRPSASPSGR